MRVFISKRIGWMVFVLLLVALHTSANVTAQTQHKPIIVEIAAGSELSARDEYVELHNPSYGSFEIDGWKLQYSPHGKSVWYDRATLSGQIVPGGRYLIAVKQESFRQASMKSGLSAAGGELRLLDSGAEEIDRLAWSAANPDLTEGAVALEPGQSVKRRVDEDGLFIDSGSGTDFFVSNNPTPVGVDWQDTEQLLSEFADLGAAPETPEHEDSITTNTRQQSSKIDSSCLANDVIINEIMPDPEPPQKDSTDEFVELYNTGKQVVRLDGCTLGTGSKQGSSYKLSGAIMPGEFRAFFSKHGSMRLTNSGGQVRLVGSSGELVVAVEYPKSKPGISYSKLAAGWGWVLPTPGKPNAEVLSDNSSLSSAAKSTGHTGPGDTQSSSFAGAELDDSAQESAVSGWHTLAVGSVLGLLYAGHEHREVIKDTIGERRGHLASRVRYWLKATRSRSDRAFQRYRWRQNGLRKRSS